ncbi:LD-carboxypeptidase [Staphylococcus pseudintermedius]|nr:LD-carboxypeptidase [Staphylococcus pseudintermedius]MDA3112410.1 LD-carboxypeptidase [Staphylococcus pseudintermedius]
MIKPQKLKKGDTIAIVSPSSGLAGEPQVRWRTEQGIENIQTLGYHVKVMDNSLNGIAWNFEHPKERAEILTAAFVDSEVQAILCTIGGYESVRIIPFLDDEVIRQHPKIFIGYSDITPLHLHMYKLGITSFYGPALLTDFAENVELDAYTVDHLFSAIGDT